MKKTLLLLSVLATSCFQLSYAQLSAGLVAHYPFGGTADDASGHDNHGIISGTVTNTADRFGAADCAYEFTGDTSSYINVPYDTSMAYVSDGAVSISLWYQGGSSEFGDFECLWGQLTGTSSVPYNLYLSLYDLNRANFVGSVWEDIATTDTGGVDWHHLAGIYNDGNYTLYKDNTLVGTYAGTPITPLTNNFIIGKNFEGKIDDIRVYNRAITIAEIDSIFELPGSCGTLDVKTPAFLSSVIYPNPTTGLVQIKMSEMMKILEIKVYDMMGRQVVKKSLIHADYGAVELSDQPDGTYFIQISNGRETKSTLVRKTQ